MGFLQICKWVGGFTRYVSELVDLPQICELVDLPHL